MLSRRVLAPHQIPEASEKQVLMTLTEQLPQAAISMRTSGMIPLSCSSTVRKKTGETLQPLNHQAASCLTLHSLVIEEQCPRASGKRDDKLNNPTEQQRAVAVARVFCNRSF